MVRERRRLLDPRTVGREIPGIIEALLPQLTPGIVAHWNKGAYSVPGCLPVSEAIISGSGLHRAMLFEIAVAAGEQLLEDKAAIDWESALGVACARQRRHFDARMPQRVSTHDRAAAECVARNLVGMLQHISNASDLIRMPRVPGFEWIASGLGDFSVGSRLVEVKCATKRFSSADYRQIVMYWLLSYAASVESGALEWTTGVLLNPRLNMIVEVEFDEIVRVSAAGRTKADLLQLFGAMVTYDDVGAVKG